MNLAQVQKEIHENAVAHGWWEVERNTPEMLALIHSEISEAYEAYERDAADTFMTRYVDGKPEGVHVELADAVIRILDVLYTDGVVLDVLTPTDHGNGRFFKTLLTAHGEVSRALELYRIAGKRDTSFHNALIECARECAGASRRLAYGEGQDIEAFWQAFEVKVAYNKNRPYRHGGKVC